MTDAQLHGLEIVDSNYCVFCLEEPETTMHLFCNCKFVDMFWYDMSDWLSVKFFYNFNLDNRHKLFDFKKTTVSFSLQMDYFCRLDF